MVRILQLFLSVTLTLQTGLAYANSFAEQSDLELAQTLVKGIANDIEITKNAVFLQRDLMPVQSCISIESVNSLKKYTKSAEQNFNAKFQLGTEPGKLLKYSYSTDCIEIRYTEEQRNDFKSIIGAIEQTGVKRLSNSFQNLLQISHATKDPATKAYIDNYLKNLKRTKLFKTIQVWTMGAPGAAFQLLGYALAMGAILSAALAVLTLNPIALVGVAVFGGPGVAIAAIGESLLRSASLRQTEAELIGNIIKLQETVPAHELLMP